MEQPLESSCSSKRDHFAECSALHTTVSKEIRGWLTLSLLKTPISIAFCCRSVEVETASSPDKISTSFSLDGYPSCELRLSAKERVFRSWAIGSLQQWWKQTPWLLRNYSKTKPTKHGSCTRSKLSAVAWTQGMMGELILMLSPAVSSCFGLSRSPQYLDFPNVHHLPQAQSRRSIFNRSL